MTSTQPIKPVQPVALQPQITPPKVDAQKPSEGVIQRPQITLVKVDVPKVPQGAIPRPPIPNPRQTPNTPPTIYLIRHGEKVDDVTNAKQKMGLVPAGFDRANALPLIFNDENRTNPYDIRLILAMQPQPTGAQERPYETIWPLFLSLSQTEDNYCLLDNTVHEESVKLAARRIKEYIASGSPGNILVCWEHGNLPRILEEFGFTGAPKYPEYFDVVWVLEPTAKNPGRPAGIPTNAELDLNPDNLSSQARRLWSWNTITWWSEGTTTEVMLEKTNLTLWQGKSPMTTTSKDPQQGPTYTWEPYNPTLEVPATKGVKMPDAEG